MTVKPNFFEVFHVTSLVDETYDVFSIKKGGPASVVYWPPGQFNLAPRTPTNYPGGMALIDDAKPGVHFEWIEGNLAPQPQKSLKQVEQEWRAEQKARKQAERAAEKAKAKAARQPSR